MKQAWRLAASDGALSPQQIVALYGKRALRQTMDHPTELPRQQGHTLWHGPERTADRRSSTPRRLLPLNAFATFLLTILCAAGESLGMDRQLQTRTAKRRVHSLFRQSCVLYDLIPNMPEQRLRPLIEKYADLPGRNTLFAAAFDLA